MNYQRRNDRIIAAFNSGAMSLGELSERWKISRERIVRIIQASIAIEIGAVKPSPFAWTAERDAILRQLALGGVSQERIAARIGDGCTRDMVAHRISETRNLDDPTESDRREARWAGCKFEDASEVESTFITRVIRPTTIEQSFVGNAATLCVERP